MLHCRLGRRFRSVAPAFSEAASGATLSDSAVLEVADHVANEGKLVAVVAAEVLDVMLAHERGAGSEIIREVTVRPPPRILDL